MRATPSSPDTLLASLFGEPQTSNEASLSPHGDVASPLHRAYLTEWLRLSVSNDRAWRYRGENSDIYQNEPNEFFDGSRSGKLINDSYRIVQSTLLGIMGRRNSIGK